MGITGIMAFNYFFIWLKFARIRIKSKRGGKGFKSWFNACLSMVQMLVVHLEH